MCARCAAGIWGGVVVKPPWRLLRPWLATRCPQCISYATVVMTRASGTWPTIASGTLSRWRSTSTW